MIRYYLLLFLLAAAQVSYSASMVIKSGDAYAGSVTVPDSWTPTITDYGQSIAEQCEVADYAQFVAEVSQ